MSEFKLNLWFGSKRVKHIRERKGLEGIQSGKRLKWYLVQEQIGRNPAMEKIKMVSSPGTDWKESSQGKD